MEYTATNREKFASVYSVFLELEIKARPLDYCYGVEMIPVVVDRMILALARGSGNKDSKAIKKTCKTLGIKYTYSAIQAYLAE